MEKKRCDIVKIHHFKTKVHTFTLDFMTSIFFQRVDKSEDEDDE